MKKLMRKTVTSGTATALSGRGYEAGGKTGSAEFHNGSTDSHAWFVGYGEKNGKKLVVSVVVEAVGTRKCLCRTGCQKSVRCLPAVNRKWGNSKK